MILFVKENPFTVEQKTLEQYRRTFLRRQEKATANQQLCTLWSPPRAEPVDPSTLEFYTVFVTRQGSFTAALILSHDGGIESMGMAKLNRDCDRDNLQRSEHIAVRRAIDNLFVDQIKELGRPDGVIANRGEPNEDGVMEVERGEMTHDVTDSIAAAMKQSGIVVAEGQFTQEQLEEFLQEARTPGKALLLPAGTMIRIHQGKEVANKPDAPHNTGSNFVAEDGPQG